MAMKPLTIAQQKRINERHAPLINTTYLLAIVIEGITADIGLKSINKVASKLRGEIYGSSKNHSEAFGEWADKMEELFMDCESPFYRRQVLYILCDKFYAGIRELFVDKTNHTKICRALTLVHHLLIYIFILTNNVRSH